MQGFIHRIAVLCGAILLALSHSSHAAGSEMGLASMLYINGQGKASVEADQVSIQFNLNATSKTLEDVSETVSENLDEVLDWLDSHDETDIEYWLGNLSRRDIYRTKRRMDVRLDKRIDVNVYNMQLLDTLTTIMSAHGFTMGRTAWSTSKEDELKSEAILAASNDARRRAEQFATALGVSLGKVYTISIDGAGPLEERGYQTTKNSGGFTIDNEGAFHARGGSLDPVLIVADRSSEISVQRIQVSTRVHVEYVIE